MHNRFKYIISTVHAIIYNIHTGKQKRNGDCDLTDTNGHAQCPQSSGNRPLTDGHRPLADENRPLTDGQNIPTPPLKERDPSLILSRAHSELHRLINK